MSRVLSRKEEFHQKCRDSPFFPLALVGFASSAVYGATQFSSRGEMSPSVFLMRLRVAAQGVAVATIAAGAVYTFLRNGPARHKH